MEKCYCLTEARRVSDGKSKKCLALWNSLTNSFARHGQCENAISVFEEMMQSADCDITPHIVTFISLLIACSHRRRLNRVLLISS